MKLCKDCGKEIDNRSKRCIQCAGKNQKGKNNPMFEVHRFGDKSPAWKGGLPECEDCGKTLGDRRSKLCTSCRGKRNLGKNNPNFGNGEKFRGNKNPRWNKNLTEEERKLKRNFPEYSIWRKNIFERDNYTCQRCHQLGKTLNAHHIESWNTNKELRIEESNGIIFCQKCHKKFHKIYGKGNNNLTQLKTFIGENYA